MDARFLTVGKRNCKYGKGESLNKLSGIKRFKCELMVFSIYRQTS